MAHELGTLSIEELIKRLEKFRGPYLGDGINPGIDVPSLLKALQQVPGNNPTEKHS